MHLASHPRDDDAAQPRFNVALGSMSPVGFQRLPRLIWVSGAVNVRLARLRLLLAPVTRLEAQTSRLQSQDTSTLTWSFTTARQRSAVNVASSTLARAPASRVLDCNVATTPPAQPGPSESRSATEPPRSLVVDPRRHSVPESEPVVADQVVSIVIIGPCTSWYSANKSLLCRECRGSDGDCAGQGKSTSTITTARKVKSHDSAAAKAALRSRP